MVNVEPLDTRITNGRFVGPGAPASSTLTIHNGKVIDASDQDVWRTVNASGHLVFPGIVQPTGIDHDSALPGVRSGVTTAINSCGEVSTACLDWISSSATAITIVEPDPSGALSADEWDLLASDEPVHFQPATGSGLPVIHFLYHEGHVKRSLPLARVAEVTSGNIARELGLFPDKGGFMVGSDGDLFVFDPESHDPYNDVPWPGRVIFSLLRGKILLYNGEIHTAAGDGRRLD